MADDGHVRGSHVALMRGRAGVARVAHSSRMSGSPWRSWAAGCAAHLRVGQDRPHRRQGEAGTHTPAPPPRSSGCLCVPAPALVRVARAAAVAQQLSMRGPRRGSRLRGAMARPRRERRRAAAGARETQTAARTCFMTHAAGARETAAGARETQTAARRGCTRDTDGAPHA